MMRRLIDTNILISAALFPSSVPAKAYMAAVSFPHHAIVCDYSFDEMRKVYNRKFPDKIPDFQRFAALLALSVDIVVTQDDEISEYADEQTGA